MAPPSETTNPIGHWLTKTVFTHFLDLLKVECNCTATGSSIPVESNETNNEDEKGGGGGGGGGRGWGQGVGWGACMIKRFCMHAEVLNSGESRPSLLQETSDRLV